MSGELREKVIKGLELCLQGDSNLCKLSCPYYQQCGAFYENNEALLKDSLALLKAQEPVCPTIKQEMDDICSCIDNVAYCGRCGARIGRLKQNYCSECGQAVKWE